MGLTNSPFATFLIIGPVCFFLGMLFSSFPYDYYVLWATPTDSSVFGGANRDPYYNILESHLRFIHAAPPLINRVLHLVMATGIIGLLVKLYKPSEANMLFDGASLVLYMCGITVYIANIVKGLRLVTEGRYVEYIDVKGQGAEALGTAASREDSLKVLAASNTILALVLVGVLVLQAGQWYAQKKEAAEIEEMDRVAAEKKTGKVAAAGGEKDKKKQ